MKHITIALAAVLLLGGSTKVLFADDAPGNAPAVADKGVTGPHPRLDEVFKRLGRQNREILAKEKSGGMNLAQGNALDMKDKKIRTEVRTMAENGGDLTRTELQSLDSKLNDVRMEITAE